MYKREVTIIEKYKQADEVRKLKEHFRKHSLVEEYKDRIKEMRAVEKVAELEVEAKIAWRFRESRNAINAHKKSIDSKIQSEILKLKVKQDLRKQAKKIGFYSRIHRKMSFLIYTDTMKNHRIPLRIVPKYLKYLFQKES